MKIAVLCSACQTTGILLSRLAEREGDTVFVLREPKLKASTILRYRMRRLGLLPALGQVAFMAVIAYLLARVSRARAASLLALHAGRVDRLSDMEIRDVPTVNDQAVVDGLAAFDPDIVLVNGTRIIRGRVLDAVAAPFINIHAGITPQYRGVHGGYWALYSGDSGNFGSTIHLVDKGVDTGPVLAYVRTSPDPEDNFATYPLLQFLETLPVMDGILDDLPAALASAPAVAPDVPSRQWYHPTLWQYISGRLRGVK